MKKMLITSSTVLLITLTAYAATYTNGAKKVSMKTQAMWMSANSDCSSPQLVFDTPNAESKDFAQSLELGGGGNSIPDGFTANCVILKVSDQLAVEVDSSVVSGSALCSVFKGQDMYSPANLESGWDGTSPSSYRGTDENGSDLAAPIGPSTNQNDGTVHGKGGLSAAAEQSIYLFFTTGTNDGDIFRKPNGSGQGGAPLSAPITISGNTTLAFKIVGSVQSIKNLTDTSGSECAFSDSSVTFKVEKL